MGQCKEGPYLCVIPGNIWYKEMTPESGARMIEAHIENGQPLTDKILYQEGMETMNTNIPSTQPAPSSFTTEKDPELGTIRTALAEAGPLSCYSMLKTIFEEYPGHTIRFSTAKRSYPDFPYTRVSFDGTRASIPLPDNQAIHLVIGTLPENASTSVQKDRIDQVNIFHTVTKAPAYGIRFRDKSGETQLVVWDIQPEVPLWNHFKKVFLEHH